MRRWTFALTAVAVVALLAGDALAQRPGGGGRRPGGTGGRGSSGGFLPGRVQDQLKLTDEQKKKVEALQKESTDKLNAILTDAQKKTLADMRSGAGRRPGGTGGRGTINVDSILERRDTNKDGKISKKEAGDRWERTYAPLDKNKDGYVDKKELAELANRFGGGSRRPGGTRRPGGGRPGGGNRQID